MSWTASSLVFLLAGIPRLWAVRVFAPLDSSQGAGLPSVEMDDFKCKGRVFLSPMEDSVALQDLIRAELKLWTAHVEQNTENMTSRSEAAAAVEILEQIATPLKVITQYMGSSMKGEVKRWASFTRGPGDSLAMQAVALVETNGGDLTVHGIVSRRSLVNDEAAVSGGGKALLSSLLEMLHQEDLTRNVVLLGSPGDSFVDKLYRKHGMEEIGRTQDDYAKLQLVIKGTCVNFMRNAILCDNRGITDLASIAFRLIPESDRLLSTCAHALPRELYLDNIGKMLGYAN